MKKTMNTIRFADQLMAAFDAANFPYHAFEHDDQTAFFFASANGASDQDICLIVDDLGDCRLRSYPARGVSEDKELSVLRAINALNAQYRYICLSMDTDGDVCAGYDFTIRDGVMPVDEQVMEQFYLFSDILNDCLPDLMKALWEEEARENASFEAVVKTTLFEKEGDAE